jgi:hypothetical protein
MKHLQATAATILLAVACGPGCATWHADRPVVVADAVYAAPSVERGSPNRFVDGAGWALGIPGKVLLWDRRTENHAVSAETEQAVVEYMATNGLGSTKVRINQYAPGDEWRRLVANKNVGAGWRYTFGAMRTAAYTVFPGRLFGNDEYNPYTDTVSVYSDIPALAMEQAAHAKIVKGRPHPGTYATVHSLPFLTLNPEGKAKRMVVAHVGRQGSTDEQVAAIKTLSPQYGIETGTSIGVLFPGSQFVWPALGAGIGHGAGWFEARDLRIEAEHLAALEAHKQAVGANNPVHPRDAEVMQAAAVAPISQQ